MKKLCLLNLLMVLFGCLFIVACSGSDGDGEEPGGGGGTLSGNLVLSSSSLYINPDGKDATVLTVRMGDTDVTGKAKIYLNNAEFEGTSFTATKEGQYTFFASYETEISEKITIEAIDGMPAMPNDPQANKFDGFVHRVLAVQSTGTWCQYCPFMIAGIKSYLETNDNGNAIFVAAHNGDEMSNDYSNAVNKWLSISSYPTLTLNLDSKNKVGHQNAPTATAAAIGKAISATLKDDAFVGISAASVTKNNSKLTVRAKVKIGTEGQYRIAAWLLEDGIKADQENSTGLTDDFSIHNNVLRASSATAAYGSQLGGSASLAKGTVAEYACSFNLTAAKISSLAKCRIVLLVTTPKNGKFIVDNVVTCPIDGNIAFGYE